MSNPSSTLAGSSPALAAQQPANGAGAGDNNAIAGPSNPPPPSTTTNGSNPAQPNGQLVSNGDGPMSMPIPAEAEITNAFSARREEEMARKDRSLAEFLKMLDGFNPLIPDEVTEYYLQRAGFDCSDPRLKRLLSLSAQKFVSDLSRDAYHYAKLRTSGTAASRGRPSATGAGSGAAGDKNKVVLTMDDLSLALGDHGVNARKPDYYL